LILMSFGCGPAILATSKFYKITLPFSILMAVSVYYLNDILIDIYGINGAALSTLIVVLFFTSLKIVFIKYKLKISPYSINSIKVISIITIMFFAFQNFKLTDNNILSIIIDSVLITIIYTSIIYFMNVSEPINKLIKNILSGKLRL
ncbi:MAG: sugar isomerase, partial [Flavobacteriaceae bacterium]|nr:sugar isomerase [Flavobacteriaceae bacterium]